MQFDTTIYLIGFMGSGKTTIGKKLASKLRCRFIDLDEKIEAQTGLNVPDIFSEKGESYFRKVESEVLKSLAGESGIVVSTGGGTPCFGSNLKLMLETGLTIYLRLTPEQLESRLMSSRSQRPLLKNVDKDKLLGYISGKLAEREKWYNQASMIIDAYDIDYTFLLSRVRELIKH